MQRSHASKGLLLYPIFLLLAAVILYPLVWMTYSSFKGNADIFAAVFALPRELYLGNYVTVFTQGAMGLYFRNSLVISIVSVAGLLAFSSLAAYAFASFRFRGSTGQGLPRRRACDIGKAFRRLRGARGRARL